MIENEEREVGGIEVEVRVMALTVRVEGEVVDGGEGWKKMWRLRLFYFFITKNHKL